MLSRSGYLMSVWSCARLDKNSMLDAQTNLLEKLTHFYWHVPKNLSQNAKNLYNMHILPNRECPPRGQPLSFWSLIFFNQSVGSIACYVTRQVGTLNAINHFNQRCHGTSDPQQQIVIKMLYQWGIVCKQSNVSEWVSEWVNVCVCVCECVCVCINVMTIFISSLVVDCVNVNVRAYVLQVGKSIVALLPCSIHFQCVMK